MFPFTINNTLKLLSHNSESVEDDIIKDRINQTIFQSFASKKNVKINAIVVVECDNEPKRTLMINDASNGTIINPNIQIAATIPNNPFASISSNSSTNHAGVLVQQSPLFSTTIEDLQALFNMSTSNMIIQNVSVPETTNHMNFSFIPTQNSSPESCVKNEKSIYNNETSLSTRKRKAEKPIKIPQDSTTEYNGLDLSINVKQDNTIKRESESKMERFFNYNLPIWPSATSSNMKSVISHTAPIVIKPKKPQSIPGHKKSSKVFSCNQCKLQFNSLNALCKHTFSDHRAFRCTFCSANFTQRSNLQRHSLKHVGFKPFICNVCSKAYYRKDHLVRHIEVSHPGSDPKSNITVKLSSSECLEYLERMQTNRLIALENIEEKKEQIDTLFLETLEKASSFDQSINENDNGPFNEEGVGINENEINKFISSMKEEIESPGMLHISMEDNISNRESNGIKEEKILTSMSGSSHFENCQDQLIKNCI